MRYAIWRHENALGNSAEQTVALAKYLKEVNDTEPEIIVELEFQKDFALCIPNVTEDNIGFFGPGSVETAAELNSACEQYEVKVPIVYAPDPKSEMAWPGWWAYLPNFPEVTLRFPHDGYTPKVNIPKDCIVMQIRERGTFAKRGEGAYFEDSRFVDPKTFFDLALHYANQGRTVVRLGDEKQTPMPKHDNIIDFAMVPNRRMLDDLYVLDQSKVFLSCDSGIWPIAGGMKKNLVISNVTCTALSNTNVQMDWLPTDTSIIIKKSSVGGQFVDNTFDELKSAVDSLLLK